MSPNFYRTKWSDYLGESRPYLDEYVVPEAAQICPQQLILNGSPVPEYNGTYDRLYSYTGGSFYGGYIQVNNLVPYLYTLPPPTFYPGPFTGDGKTYAIYGRQNGTYYYTMIARFTESGSFLGWNLYRSFNGYFFNYYAINNYTGGPFYKTEFDNTYYPSRGRQSILHPIFGYMTVTYPDICPTPTNPQLTPTNTPTPSITSTPTITPTNTPTPTVSPIPCFEVGTGFNSTNSAILVEPNTFMVVGASRTYAGTSYGGAIRIFNNGSIDSSFNVGSAGFGAGSALTVAEDTFGKYVFGGTFATFSGLSYNRIVRTNSDGSLDTTFTAGTGFITGQVTHILSQPDNKLIAVGSFTSYNGFAINRIIRLNYDGTRDTTFSAGTGFNANVVESALQSTGKIVVVGQFNTYNGSANNYIVRLNTDGTKDFTFTVPSFNVQISGLVIQPDDKIICYGLFSTVNSITYNRIIRLNSDGTIDSTFNIGTGFNSTTTDLALQSDGKMVVVGAFGSYNGTVANRIIRLNSDGSIDSTFDEGFGFDNNPNVVSILSNGKIVSVGNFSLYQGSYAPFIAAINQDGSSADCPAPSPTPTPTATPTITPTVTQTVSPTLTSTPTLTVTPSSSPSNLDFYLANQFTCVDCSQTGSNIVVGFATGTPVTVGQFYNDELVTGSVYQILSSTTGPATVTCILPGQSTCAAACAL